ncbi:MAG: hypothetical protein ACXADY_05855 [Candidatus Hodarchaeales archaeon]
MDLASFLNYYCRKIGIWFLSLIPVFLAFTLIMLALLPSGATDEFRFIYLISSIVYIVLIVIAIPFSLNGFFMEKAFNKEIRRITSSGLLIRGVEGFNEIESSIKLLYRSSYSITGSVCVSFLVFISALLLDPAAGVNPTTAVLARLFIFVASIGLLAISSGASILLRLPDKSALQPGGLMKFYSPKSISLKLDNVLTDSIFTHLDPITRIHMDEWSKSIQENLNVNYLSNLDDQTRLERAREKIFLMIYLEEFIPEIMTKEIFQRELTEIIDPNYLIEFQTGKHSGISSKTLNVVMRDIKNEIPQVFELIQRIFVLVADNLRYLQTREEFVTICHPVEHIGNIDPFRITIFVLNLKEVQRKVQIQAQTSMSSLDPDDASQLLLLDIGKLELPPEDTTIEFSSSTQPIDILRLVSSILQVGDILNLQFRPNRTGTHVLNISINDPDRGILTGKSVVIEVRRDLRYFAKTVGAKVLGYAGAAISFIGIGMGSLVGLFGF